MIITCTVHMLICIMHYMFAYIATLVMITYIGGQETLYCSHETLYLSVLQPTAFTQITGIDKKVVVCYDTSRVTCPMNNIVLSVCYIKVTCSLCDFGGQHIKNIFLYSSLLRITYFQNPRVKFDMTVLLECFIVYYYLDFIL